MCQEFIRFNSIEGEQKVPDARKILQTVGAWALSQMRLDRWGLASRKSPHCYYTLLPLVWSLTIEDCDSDFISSLSVGWELGG